MSSPQMTRMFGFFAGGCAHAWATAVSALIIATAMMVKERRAMGRYTSSVGFVSPRRSAGASTAEAPARRRLRRRLVARVSAAGLERGHRTAERAPDAHA